MKPFNKNLLWISITALALTGCGGSSSSSSDDEVTEEHEHESSILISQTSTDTLSLLEDGELEALEGATAGNGATLVLGESGAYAAALNSSESIVNFIHGLHDEEEEEGEAEHDHEEEAHVLDFSLTGDKVITTDGHFAILNETTGITTFIEYDELENDTPATEVVDLGVTETYPALMIDEDHEVVMVFDGINAKIYEGLTEEASFACANPISHGQTDELVVVSCDEGALAVVIEEGESDEHTFTNPTLDLDGNEEGYIWRAQGHVIVGFEPDTSHYAIVELNDDNGEIVLVQGSDTSAQAIERTICDIQFDSEEQDIFVLGAGDDTNEGDKLVVLGHEGELLKEETLNTLNNTDCGDLVMASASDNALVINNSVQKAYDIDAHEGDNYHVHSTYDLSILGESDIASVVIFHEKDEDADHDHNHE